MSAVYKKGIIPLLIVALFLYATEGSRAADTDAPEISNVVINEVTENSAIVTWTTDEEGDSIVNY